MQNFCVDGGRFAPEDRQAFYGAQRAAGAFPEPSPTPSAANANLPLEYRSVTTMPMPARPGHCPSPVQMSLANHSDLSKRKG